MLKNWDVNINYSTYSDKGPPEPIAEAETIAPISNIEQQSRESDTDSSINKKTKASILNRMANMGHSILPTRAPPAEISSDSSETVEAVIKTARHKPIKASTKRSSIENIANEHQNLTEEYHKIKSGNLEFDRHVALYNNQYMPLSNTSVVTGNSSEFGMFMTEQRINNSELRININRITDKMDMALKTLSSLEHKEKDRNVSTDVMLKLLAEYENKIKIYEDAMKSKSNFNNKKISDALTHLSSNNEVELLKSKISEVENDNVAKCNEISILQKEINDLNKKHSQDIQLQTNEITELHKKVSSLESELQVKDKELSDLKISSNTKVDKDNIEEKVKNIMNDTFQTISTNFDNNENYSGETIKRIIGSVIKKITIQSLSEL